MRTTSRFITTLSAAVAALASSLSMAGGPTGSFVCGANPPTKYSSTVNLNFDRGNSAGSSTSAALGTRTKAQADAIVEAAIALWTGVSTAAAPLVRGSDMTVDLTASNYSGYFSAYTDGLNPVMYDTDGTIIDAIYGTGTKSSVLGLAGSAISTSGTSCAPAEGVAIINGYISSTDTRLTQVVAHELGHLIGLDHTQLDSTQGLTVANYPIMYPSSSSSSTATLKDDDKSAISALYPSSTVFSTYQYVYGNFYLADGTTAIKGANLWLKNTSDGKLYSVVSDYLMQGTGYFRFLVPPGTYNLYAEAISTSFISGSSVGPYSEALTDSSFQSPMYPSGNGTGTAMSTLTFGNASPTAITVTSSCGKQVTFKFDGTGTVSSTCTSVPGAPTISSATAGDSKITVAFSAPASTGGLTISSYTVTCGTATTSGSASPITVTGLTNGTTYSCTVTATNSLGTSSASSALSATPAKAPGTPVLATLTAGDGQVVATFTAPSTNGSAITAYTVTCTPSGSATGLPAGLSLTVTGLTNGTAYTCSVTATNAIGTSASSATKTATPVGVPGAPTIGTVTAGNAQISVAYTAPASNGGAAITGYTATCTTGATSVTGTGTASPIIVSGLTNGSAYTCKVKATNSSGTGAESAASASVTPYTVPGAPTISSVTAGNTQLAVAFSAPSSNGGSAITGYTATCGTTSVSGITSPITVTGLTNGTSYTCTVTAKNIAGTGSTSSSLSGTPATVPGAPTIGTPTAGNAQISVAFTAPASNGGAAVTGYTATCSTGATSFTATGTASPVVVTGLTNASVYTCKVKATNSAGSGADSAASVSATPFTTPGAPTITSVTAGNSQVNVAFTAPASNGGSAITGYTATCGTQSATGTTSPISVTGLTNGTAVTCTVKATNAAGSGSASAASSSVTPATVPGAPTINSVTAGNGSVTVAFTAPASNGGSAIIDYAVSCGSVNLLASTSPVTVTGLTNGVAVTCTVTAGNIMGAGATATSSSVTPVGPPTAPTITGVTAGNAQVIVAFSAPSSNGGSAITGYTATCGSQSASGTASPITVTGLTNGTAVTCTVKATNALGTSSASSASASVTPVSVPGAPTIGTVTAGVNQVSVAFTAPSDNGGSAITGYTATCGSKSASGTASPITVTGLTAGSSVTCTVKATNTTGTGASSATSASVTLPNVPGAPEITDLSTASQSVIVSFGAPSSDGGSAITSYKATCGTTSVTGSASPLTLTGLTAGVAVSCTVTATNAVGTGPASTAGGPVTPPGPPNAPTLASVTPGGERVIVAFDAPSNAALVGVNEYTVTCTPQTGSPVSVLGSSSPITVTGLAAGVPVTCTVIADNNYGASPASNTSNSVTPYSLPTAPTITSVTAGNQQVSVAFNAPAAQPGVSVASYFATCGEKSATGTASPLIVTELDNGVAVTCTVTAVSAGGGNGAESAPSASVTPATVPAVPSLDGVTAIQRGVRVSFDLSNGNGGSAITGITVTCGSVSVTGTSGPIVVSPLTPGVAVTCTLFATNVMGNSATTAPSESVTPFDVPTAPTITSITPLNSQLSVAFSPPSTSYGYTINSYTVVCGAKQSTGTSSPILVGGLTNGASYSCTATATSSIGVSAASAAVSGTPATVPGAPSIVSATVADSQIAVNFNAPASNGGSAVLDYTATCGAKSATSTASPITVTGLTNGVSVNCSVTARNAAGTSAASGMLPGTPGRAPDAPTIGTATAGNAQVTIAFTAPTNTGGFAILDYTATCGTKSATGSASPITVTGLSNGVTVTCTVVARNLMGTSVASAASNSVTPLACSLDFSGDGVVDATDALLFNRWLFGYRDSALVNGVTAVPANATASEFATSVTTRMVFSAAHDFDGNGKVEALTEGLMFGRMVQNLTGTNVTNGAIGAEYSRNTWDAIRTHVNQFCGTGFNP